MLLIEVYEHMDMVIRPTNAQKLAIKLLKFFPNETIYVFTLVKWYCFGAIFG